MLFAIYLTVTLLIGGLTVYSFIWYKRKVKLFELTEETTGIITKISKGRIAVNSHPKGQVYNISIRYTIDGKDYTTSMQYEGDDKSFEEGQALTVLYDPEKPSRAIPKDFDHDHAMYYWRMFVILAIILFVIAVCVTMFTAPNTLLMSRETELKYKICTEAFGVIAIPTVLLFIRRTDEYKNEMERDPKGSKRTLIGAAAIWGDCLISLIFNIISILYY